MQMIELTGRAGSGKTTIVNWLCSDFGFVNVALADPITEGLKAMLGISNERLKDQPIGWLNRSPRELMQSLGTDWGRHIAENICLRVADLRITCTWAASSSETSDSETKPTSHVPRAEFCGTSTGPHVSRQLSLRPTTSASSRCTTNPESRAFTTTEQSINCPS